METTRNARKTRVGMVTSNAMDKTITVSLENFVRHSLYGKAVKRSKKVKAHDAETRPLSKDKRWRLVEMIEKVK